MLHVSQSGWGCAQFVHCTLGLYMRACCLHGCTPDPASRNTALVPPPFRSSPPPTQPLPSLTRPLPCPPAGLKWGEEGWRRMTWSKVFVLDAVVDYGFNVVMSDVDVVWFKDPRPLFAEHPAVGKFGVGKGLGRGQLGGAGVCLPLPPCLPPNHLPCFLSRLPACLPADVLVGQDHGYTANAPGDAGLEVSFHPNLSDFNTGKRVAGWPGGGWAGLLLLWCPSAERLGKPSHQLGHLAESWHSCRPWCTACLPARRCVPLAVQPEHQRLGPCLGCLLQAVRQPRSLQRTARLLCRAAAAAAPPPLLPC